MACAPESFDEGTLVLKITSLFQELRPKIKEDKDIQFVHCVHVLVGLGSQGPPSATPAQIEEAEIQLREMCPASGQLDLLISTAKRIHDIRKGRVNSRQPKR